MAHSTMSVKRPVLKFVGIAVGIALLGAVALIIRSDREPIRDATGHVIPCPVCGQGRAEIYGIIERAQFWKVRTTRAKFGCHANLMQIEGVIDQWALENKKSNGDPLDRAAILGFLKGSRLPACDEGGNYYVPAFVGERPVCSLEITCPEHTLDGVVRTGKAADNKAKK